MTKFTYETEEDRGECVAFIDESGDLAMRSDTNGTLWILTNGNKYIYDDDFEKSMKDNPPVKKFYKGDSITITF